jgi:hypothetical protein
MKYGRELRGKNVEEMGCCPASTKNIWSNKRRGTKLDLTFCHLASGTIPLTS